MLFRREDRTTHTRLLISGVLDALSASELRATLDQLIGARTKSIVIDVAGLVFIDSSGVAALVSLFKRARSYGGRVVIQGAVDQPRAVFKLLSLHRVFVDLDGGESRIDDAGELRDAS